MRGDGRGQARGNQDTLSVDTAPWANSVLRRTDPARGLLPAAADERQAALQAARRQEHGSEAGPFPRQDVAGAFDASGTDCVASGIGVAFAGRGSASGI